MGTPQRKLTAKDLVDLAIAVIPIIVVVGIQYRDEIKRAQMWAEKYLTRDRDREAEALKQVQKEISWMEHGVGDAD